MKSFKQPGRNTKEKETGTRPVGSEILSVEEVVEVVGVKIEECCGTLIFTN